MTENTQTQPKDEKAADKPVVSGTVVESDASGKKHDVPFHLLDEGEKKPRTSDSDDKDKDWTAQQAEGKKRRSNAAVTPAPGQAFRKAELPDREVVEAAGINYDQFVAGLPVRDDVKNEAPRKGTPA